MARGDFPSAKLDQYMLRFPDGMRDRLKDQAAKNNRSMNAEIIHRLEHSLNADKPDGAFTSAEDLAQDIAYKRRHLTVKEKSLPPSVNKVFTEIVNSFKEAGWKEPE